MNKITKAEKWFGKKKKDLIPEELKEFWRLDAQERRNNPEVREYHQQYNKQYNAQYRKDNKEKINKSIKEWKQNNPEKIKGYRYAKLNREIEALKRALKETTDLMQKYLMEKLELQEKLANTENDHINDKLYKQDHKIAVLERALELAVADKCKYENLMVEGIVGKGAKVAIPKKEQWYKEQAESDIKNEKE